MARLVLSLLVAGLLSAATAQFCLDQEVGACYIAQEASQTDCASLGDAWYSVTDTASCPPPRSGSASLLQVQA